MHVQSEYHNAQRYTYTPKCAFYSWVPPLLLLALNLLPTYPAKLSKVRVGLDSHSQVGGVRLGFLLLILGEGFNLFQELKGVSSTVPFS